MTSVWLGSWQNTLSHKGLVEFSWDICYVRTTIGHDLSVGYIRDDHHLDSDDSTFSQVVDQILDEVSENGCEQLLALSIFCTHP